MLDKATCPICTAQYLDGEVAALVCGHTFHLSCIERWLTTSKTCPSCRKNIGAKNGIIKQLFFTFDDEEDESPADKEDAARKLKELTMQHKQLENKLLDMQHTKIVLEAELEERIKESKFQNSSIANKEKRIASLQESLRWMEEGQRENETIKKQCQKLEDALRACEFYNVVVKSKGEERALEGLRKFCKDGRIETDEYFKLMKQNVDKYQKKMAENSEEIRNLKAENSKLLSKERELKNIVTALTEELRETRESCNKNTPYNAKLKPFLDKSPHKRISMGFNDDTIDLDSEVFDSALRKPPAKKPFRPLQPCFKISPEAMKVTSLDDFCALEEAGLIRVEDAKKDAAKDVVRLTNGSIMSRHAYETRNERSPEITFSKVKKAHLKMESENEERQKAKTSDTKREIKPPARRPNKTSASVTIDTVGPNSAKISHFLKKSKKEVDIINLD